GPRPRVGAAVPAEQRLPAAAAGSGLVRAERLPEQLFSGRPCLCGGLDQPHAAGLAATPGMDLRLHDARDAEPLRRPNRLVDGEARLSIRHRHPVATKEILRLVLVDVHARVTGIASGRPRRNARRLPRERPASSHPATKADATDRDGGEAPATPAVPLAHRTITVAVPSR